MDIKQLKFLIALDETRHFGQAAARCHITQPTLSMRLRSLEEELELPLVNRGQRFEGFAAPGERVLAWARTVLAAYDGLQAEAAACRGNLVGTLRLGVVPLSSFDPVQPLQQTDAVHQLLQAVHGGLCCAIMPLHGGLEGLTEHLRLQPIAEARTLARLGLIMRRGAPRSALAEACFALHQRSSDKA